MRLVFAGTPAFARVALERLAAAGHDIALVLTQPDRPSGRGLKLQPSAVKQWAAEQGVPVAQPRGLRLDGKYAEDATAARGAIAAAHAEGMVVAAYGLILPAWVLAATPRGAFNIHASLLPRWRGAAPIHRAIEAGDAETGITIMRMDEGLDTGDMLLSRAVPIGPRDTTGSLHDTLAALGGELMVEALALAVSGALQPRKQPEAGVTYARKVEKDEARIDWSQPAETIGRRIRAFDPTPGAFTTLGGEVLKIWRYEIDSNTGPFLLGCPVILPEKDHFAIIVGCGADADGRPSAMRLIELQRAGGRRLAAADFLRGFPIPPGARFGDAG